MAQLAHASSDYHTDQELIGWSEDGLTWVTQNVAKPEGETDRGSYVVYRRTERVAEFGRKDLGTLKREYPYVSLKPQWRKRFKARFSSKASHQAYDRESGLCMERWRVIEKGTGQIHYKHQTQWHCSNMYGGYVHPTGRYILVKYMDSMSSTKNDGYCCSFDKQYRWVELGADLKHVPQSAAKKRKLPVTFCAQVIERGEENVGCSDKTLTKLTPLAALVDTIELDLSTTRVKDIRVLSRLKKLRWLSLRETRIRTLKPIASLKQLACLNLSDTAIRDVGPLKKLTGIERLYLSRTGVANIEPLAQLILLKELSLRGTGVKDIGPLSKMTQLRTLDLVETRVKNIEALTGLTSLQVLMLSPSVPQQQVKKLQTVLPKLRIVVSGR